MKKKIYLAVAFAGIYAASMAQTQRTVLAEEFTQASCGPCAAQNPAFNALLGNNTAKVVSIKYQTNWPGVDPMNTQTQSNVGPRVTYYNVTGVPYALMDGVPQTGSAYSGAPYNWTQSGIDAEYAVSAPFAMTVTHTMSSDFDSAFVTVTITAAQNFTAAGNLMMRLAMVEKTINFSSPPGTNGETVFYSVMRNMYPSATGTNIGASWTNAQTATYNFAVAVPNYVYDKNEIAFVGFIQDDANMSVQQAAMSTPVLVTNDASATAVSGLPSMSCSTTINPVVTLKNNGSATLTSATINYKIDNNAAQTYAWTGSLASGATTNVSLGAITVSASGSHSFTAWPTMPNNQTDINTTTDNTMGSFLIMGTAAASPLIEGYTSATFPPTGWGIVNADADAPTWTRVTTCGGFQASSNAAKMDFYNSPAGTVDEMVAQNVDMTQSANKNLTFDVAYCQYSTENDQLEVMVSTDCGATWNTVYSKAGANLKTKAAQTSAFTPSSATHWRMEVVDLSAYGNATSLIIKWVATSGYGNNLYVDDINIGTTGIKENNVVSDMNVYPNPLDQNATISLNLAETGNVTVEVYSMTGELVSAQNEGQMTAGEHNIALNAANLANGMYFVTVRTGESTVTRKVSVAH